MATREREKALKIREIKEKRPHATAKYIRISSSKVAIVLDLIRGKQVNEAKAILLATPKAATEAIIKVLDSACANAENNMELNRDNLFVAEAYANMGPTLRRYRPRAQGRATRIRKRTSHITIVLDEMK